MGAVASLCSRIAVVVAGCAVALPAADAQVSIASAMQAQSRIIAADSSSSPAAAPASLEDALHAAFAAADVVFSGEVISIEHSPAAVVIRWRVDEAVRGVAASTVFEQKEWPGLWADSVSRYSVGERALVLLHAASVAGYSAPVGDGVVPLRGDAVTGTLDLRWMAQHVAVTDAARLRPMLALRAASGNLAVSDALQARASLHPGDAGPLLQIQGASDGGLSAGPVTVAPPASGVAAGINAQIDGAMVMGMLHAWQRSGAAAR